MNVPDVWVRDRIELPHGHWNTQDDLRDSAVLAILVEREGVDHLVFNRRRDDLPYHPGQICFPGGAREGDEDASECAIRETCEEMGITSDALVVLGRLPDRVSIAGFRVAPFVARLVRPVPYVLETAEVAEAFEVPCAAFFNGEQWGFTEARTKLARFRRVPYFQHEERRIWGLTGIMLRDFVTQVLGYAPPV